MAKAKPLRIAYVFMQYPYPSQTFAISDVQTLESLGHTITTHSLRHTHPKHNQLCAMYNVPDQTQNHATPKTLLTLVNPKSWPILFTGLKEILPLYKTPKHLLKSLALLPRCIELTHQLKKENPDIIHLFWSHYPALFGLLCKTHLPHIPLTQFCGAYDLETNYPLTQTLSRQNAANFTHAAANLPPLRQAGFPQKSLHIIHRGIPIKPFKHLKKTTKRTYQICIASALQPEKNIPACINALPEILKTHPKTHMLIIGDGPDRSTIKASIAEHNLHNHVTLTGYLPRSEVLQHMAESPVFLFLSQKKSDCLPNVIKEALLVGCRCIASPTKGIEELLPPKQNLGEILEDLSPLSVAKAVNYALSNTKNTEGWAWIEQNFNTKTQMQKYVDVWQKLNPS